MTSADENYRTAIERANHRFRRDVYLGLAVCAVPVLALLVTGIVMGFPVLTGCAATYLAFTALPAAAVEYRCRAALKDCNERIARRHAYY